MDAFLLFALVIGLLIIGVPIAHRELSRSTAKQ